MNIIPGGFLKLAIFDFDGTLVPKDSLPFVLDQWKEQKYLKTKYYRTYFSLPGH